VMTWRGSVQVWWELEVEDRGVSARPSRLRMFVTQWRLGVSRKMFAIRTEHASPSSEHANDMSDFTTESFTVSFHVV
jgi:hypothetical protein